MGISPACLVVLVMRFFTLPFVCQILISHAAAKDIETSPSGSRYGYPASGPILTSPGALAYTPEPTLARRAPGPRSDKFAASLQKYQGTLSRLEELVNKLSKDQKRRFGAIYKELTLPNKPDVPDLLRLQAEGAIAEFRFIQTSNLKEYKAIINAARNEILTVMNSNARGIDGAIDRCKEVLASFETRLIFTPGKFEEDFNGYLLKVLDWYQTKTGTELEVE